MNAPDLCIPLPLNEIQTVTDQAQVTVTALLPHAPNASSKTQTIKNVPTSIDICAPCSLLKPLMLSLKRWAILFFWRWGSPTVPLQQFQSRAEHAFPGMYCLPSLAAIFSTGEGIIYAKWWQAGGVKMAAILDGYQINSSLFFFFLFHWNSDSRVCMFNYECSSCNFYLFPYIQATTGVVATADGAQTQLTESHSPIKNLR